MYRAEGGAFGDWQILVEFGHGTAVEMPVAFVAAIEITF
jgi:hypothetical protein